MTALPSGSTRTTSKAGAGVATGGATSAFASGCTSALASGSGFAEGSTVGTAAAGSVTTAGTRPAYHTPPPIRATAPTAKAASPVVPMPPIWPAISYCPQNGPAPRAAELS